VEAQSLIRVIIFSDTHFRKYMRVEATNVEWLPLQLQCLKQIFDFCMEIEPDIIVFNGDLFDAKTSIDVPLFTRVWEEFSDFEYSKKVILNTGNHDIATIDGASVLTTFEPICMDVVKIGETRSWFFDDWEVKIVPFMPEINKEFLSKSSKHGILFLHQEIEGLVLGSSNYKLENPIPLEWLDEWDFVFDGHIHKPQNIGNVFAVGSIMQQNFGEAREKKRFIDLKITKEHKPYIQSIEIEGPQFFVDVKLDNKKQIDYIKNKSKSNQFFRIDINEKDISNEIFKLPNVFPKVVSKSEREVRVMKDLTDEELLEIYVKNETENKEIYNKLVEIGIKIIRENMEV